MPYVKHHKCDCSNIDAPSEAVHRVGVAIKPYRAYPSRTVLADSGDMHRGRRFACCRRFGPSRNIGVDHRFGPCSKDCLARCAGSGVLVVNPGIDAEVGAVIERIEALDEPLTACLFRRYSAPKNLLFA